MPPPTQNMLVRISELVSFGWLEPEQWLPNAVFPNTNTNAQRLNFFPNFHPNARVSQPIPSQLFPNNSKLFSLINIFKFSPTTEISQITVEVIEQLELA